ncbi:thioesterase II family protein [Ornithinibacillus scapharcae]|uniref:thioesterase II family protein n=1 Tax=Ornithinibacillus scapharcae TaxID=1147159 RepID=UPI000225AB9E|nr:alpha/beta fold hydrolase [Ornithinibacillus scapharcae]
MNERGNKWRKVISPSTSKKLTLFCFPYAGGSGHIFYNWHHFCTTDLEIQSIQLPGRGIRISELPINNIEELIKDLYAGIDFDWSQPYAFFGHSMGALISYELAAFLYEQEKELPQGLFLSARVPPHLTDRGKHVHLLSEQEFIQELRRLDGTPEEVLHNEELLQLMLPTIRADFAICETYQYTKRNPLPIPITVFGGKGDMEVSPNQLTEWKQYTSKNFQQFTYDGGHFFLHQHKGDIVQTIEKQLSNHRK